MATTDTMHIGNGIVTDSRDGCQWAGEKKGVGGVHITHKMGPWATLTERERERGREKVLKIDLPHYRDHETSPLPVFIVSGETRRLIDPSLCMILHSALCRLLTQQYSPLKIVAPPPLLAGRR